MKDEFSIDVRDNKKLDIALQSASHIITKDYLYQLEQYEVCEVSKELEDLEITELTRLYQFKKFVSDKNEHILDKLVTVLNSAYTSGATVITIIQGHKTYTNYYIGIVSKDEQQKKYDVSIQGETFKSTLQGNFPGLDLEDLMIEDIEALCSDIFKEDYITSISGITSLRNQKTDTIDQYIQGIEHLVDSMQGREYSIVVIADPVSGQDLTVSKHGYENLYTQLSQFDTTALNFSESDSLTITQSQSESIAEQIGESIARSQNHSETSGWTETQSEGTNRGASFFVSIGANESTSNAKNENRTNSTGETDTKNHSSTHQDSFTEGQSESNVRGRTIQFRKENKMIKNLENQIDKQLARLQECEAYGAFNCATYVISTDIETNSIVANSYNALMRGENSSLQASYIHHWNTQNEQWQMIKTYLKKWTHPVFNQGTIQVTPASLMNSYELAINIGVPKKSISGLPVLEMASFGRDIFEVNKHSSNYAQKLYLGQIYHMGTEEKIPVQLNVDNIASHMLITGTTGSGKSNTVYHLLDELSQKDITFLVIEPTKGEYKHVFSNRDVKIYGTNEHYTPLLKINPFKFPNGIHVLEHIDRLIEIFNVCWSMYSAMPAVLKDAIEKAYVMAGWDLDTSKPTGKITLYPTFEEVLEALNEVVNQSQYSDEVKSNYRGALATRIKSLTNGLYKQIFDVQELGDINLFTEKVIVDLSRIGSMETKSMIMGILVMRLQEYRMTEDKMNSPLRHVTVLEEAHHLLKRTSTTQISESSNLIGKSVEMLSNAISEMRTYGEGFIIVDQAPGLLDMSVVRNTNTKVILRLPDADDRTLIGKSANLSEEQIKELAKIPTGVAAIYQNNWLEPILCKVPYKEIQRRYKKE